MKHYKLGPGAYEMVNVCGRTVSTTRAGVRGTEGRTEVMRAATGDKGDGSQPPHVGRKVRFADC